MGCISYEVSREHMGKPEKYTFSVWLHHCFHLFTLAFDKVKKYLCFMGKLLEMTINWQLNSLI